MHIFQSAVSLLRDPFLAQAQMDLDQAPLCKHVALTLMWEDAYSQAALKW